MDTQELKVEQTHDGNFSVKRGDTEVALIVNNGDGWRACRMPGLRPFSPVGMDELHRVKAYALRELQERKAA